MNYCKSEFIIAILSALQIIIILIVLTFSCVSINYAQNYDKKILGGWVETHLKSKRDIQILCFGPDSMLSVEGRADTIYWYDYLLKGKYLYLKEKISDKHIKWKIIKLSDKELIIKYHEGKDIIRRFKRGNPYKP